MTFVEEFAHLLLAAGVPMFLAATYFGGVLHGRRLVAKHDEEQRRLALAVEEEKRSEEREARLQAFLPPVMVTAELAAQLRQADQHNPQPSPPWDTRTGGGRQ